MANKLGEAAGEREAKNTGVARCKARRKTAQGQELLELALIVEGLLPQEPRSERVRLRTLIFKLGGGSAANTVELAQHFAEEDGEAIGD